ncbi:MAG: hypothetical protein Ct9H300mP23_12460 [Nitrospinota bacterium]|nr:MAG: hypothetical protein Ct9H300mP23_12460 [Nitrospinota bacterium]
MSKEILKRGVEMRSLGMLKFESSEKETPELFDDIYRAGFLMLFFGLESANDRILSVIDKGCDQETERAVLKHSSERQEYGTTFTYSLVFQQKREKKQKIPLNFPSKIQK